MTTTDFWSAHPPGLKWLDPAGQARLGVEDLAAIRRARYSLESHLAEMARFDDHAGELVAEVGCGVGTDASRFLEHGASYVGFDASPTAVRSAARAFRLLGLDGDVALADATALPLASGSVDFVWSNGVLHHLDDTAGAVREIRRVLRPGGRCAVMLYHRDSFNFRLNILAARRLGAALLLLPGGLSLASRLTGEPATTLAGHRELLRRHGLRYLADTALFLSNNTDGPGNRLSKVFSRAAAAALFEGFAEVRTEVRFLNLRILPGLDRLLGDGVKRRVAGRWGWHLYVLATR